MLQQKSFNSDDLIPLPLQFLVRHKSIDCFTKGEYVFLKSNPEVPLTVTGLDYFNKMVVCMWINADGLQEVPFSPECILQYGLRGLMVYKDKFPICLN